MILTSSLLQTTKTPSEESEGSPRESRQYLYHNILPSYHHSPVIMPSINFIANGHPYKITVNNKEVKPSTMPQPPSIPNPTNSPITWITNTWGFNGQPVNIFSYPAGAQSYWAGPRRGVGHLGQWGMVRLG